MKHLKKLASQSLIYGLGENLGRAVNFLLLPVFLHYLSPSDYGVLEICWVTYTFLVLILDLGLFPAIFRFYYEAGDQSAQDRLFSTGFFLSLAACIPIVVLMILLSPTLGNLLLERKDFNYAFLFVGLNIFFNTFRIIPLAYYRAEGKAVLYSFVSLTKILANIGFSLFFLISLGLGVYGVLAGSIASSIIILLIVLPTLVKSIKFIFQSQTARDLLSFGFPIMIGTVGIAIIEISDRYFLSFLTSTSTVGIYSVGYKFGILLKMAIITPFIVAWTPFAISVSKEENAKEIYSNCLTYVISLLFALALGVSLFVKEVLILISPSEYWPAYRVVPLISSAYVFFGAYTICKIGIILTKKTKYVSITTTAGVILNLILNFFFIKAMGMYGAALSTLMSQALMLVLILTFSQKLYPVSWDFSKLLKVGVLAVFFYLFGMQIDFQNMGMTIFCKSLLFIAYVLLLLSSLIPFHKAKSWVLHNMLIRRLNVKERS